jgi:hydrogenase small subunit
MPGFPDKFMPFMDEPPGSKVSTRASKTYGATVRTLRRFTQKTLNKEPKWRVRGTELKTGYEKVR